MGCLSISGLFLWHSLRIRLVIDIHPRVITIKVLVTFILAKLLCELGITLFLLFFVIILVCLSMLFQLLGIMLSLWLKSGLSLFFSCFISLSFPFFFNSFLFCELMLVIISSLLLLLLLLGCSLFFNLLFVMSLKLLEATILPIIGSIFILLRPLLFILLKSPSQMIRSCLSYFLLFNCLLCLLLVHTLSLVKALICFNLCFAWNHFKTVSNILLILSIRWLFCFLLTLTSNICCVWSIVW